MGCKFWPTPQKLEAVGRHCKIFLYFKGDFMKCIFSILFLFVFLFTPFSEETISQSDLIGKWYFDVRSETLFNTKRPDLFTFLWIENASFEIDFIENGYLVIRFSETSKPIKSSFYFVNEQYRIGYVVMFEIDMKPYSLCLFKNNGVINAVLNSYQDIDGIPYIQIISGLLKKY